jgi:hypothetical protein
MNTRGYRFFLSVFLTSFCLMVAGQTNDSTVALATVADTSDMARVTVPDSAVKTVRRDVFLSGEGLPGPYGPRVAPYILAHPIVRTDVKPVGLPHLQRQVRDLDWIFYLFTGSLFLLGLTRVVFPGYLEDMFRGFFGFSVLQRKKGEGVARHGVASLWLNLLFLLNGSIFLYFLLRPEGPGGLSWMPWQWIGFWMGLLSAVYILKYSLILLAAWVFGKVQHAHDYMSIVFQVNRLAAILLLFAALPLALLGDVGPAFFLPWIGLVLAMLLALRLARSLAFFRKSFRIGPVQFVLLFLSFEVLPVLLLRKALWDLFL